MTTVTVGTIRSYQELSQGLLREGFAAPTTTTRNNNNRSPSKNLFLLTSGGQKQQRIKAEEE
jgi:hypothetical protein